MSLHVCMSFRVWTCAHEFIMCVHLNASTSVFMHEYIAVMLFVFFEYDLLCMCVHVLAQMRICIHTCAFVYEDAYLSAPCILSSYPTATVQPHTLNHLSTSQAGSMENGKKNFRKKPTATSRGADIVCAPFHGQQEDAQTLMEKTSELSGRNLGNC